MEITWYGLSCFRIVERKHATVVTDPFDSLLGLPPLRLKSDVITVSHEAKGHSFIEGVSGQQHVLRGPGEYEIGNVFITGIATPAETGTTQNIIYLFDYDGLTVAHLGDMQKVPTQTQIEALEEVGVLLLPVGGGKSLNAAQASELVSMLEPNIVIPMHYQLPGLSVDLDGVERFLKEMGVTEPKQDSSLKVTPGNLPEETEIILLVPRTS
jgi:L-ascorbate metabolism protein UlaG (beta-lactamase superfamily)